MKSLTQRNSIASCPSGDGTTFTTSEGQQYQLYCTTAFSGNDLPSSSAKTFTDCIEACDNYVMSQQEGGGANCVSVTFGAIDPNGNKCWLHYQITDVLNNQYMTWSARRVQYAIDGDPVFSTFGAVAAPSPTPETQPESSSAPNPSPAPQQPSTEPALNVDSSQAVQSPAVASPPPEPTSGPASSFPSSTSSSGPGRTQSSSGATAAAASASASTATLNLSFQTKVFTQAGSITSDGTPLFNTVTATATATPSPDSNPPPSSGPSLGTGAKAGLGVGFAVLVLLLLGLAGILLRQRHRGRHDAVLHRTRSAHEQAFKPDGTRSAELAAQGQPSEKDAGLPWKPAAAHELPGDMPAASELEGKARTEKSPSMASHAGSGHRRDRSWSKFSRPGTWSRV